MSGWGNQNSAANAPSWQVIAGSNVTGNNSNMFLNATPGAFTGVDGQAVGVFPASVATVQAIANTTGFPGLGVAPGWNLVRQGVGPVVSIAINAHGGSYGNLAVGSIGNGITNAYFQVTVNSTGNVTGISLGVLNSIGGFQVTTPVGNGFINAGAVGFLLPKNSVVSANISNSGFGYSNSDYIIFSNGVINALANLMTNSIGAIQNITFSQTGSGFDGTASHVVSAFNNTVSSAYDGVTSGHITAGGTSYTNGNILTFSGGATNATFTVSTNATGGISSLTLTATGSGFATNTAAVANVANSTGGSSGVGTGANIVANSLGPIYGNVSANSTSFDAGSGLTLAVQLGGRAGRVTYETLACVVGMSGGSTLPNPGNPINIGEFQWPEQQLANGAAG